MKCKTYILEDVKKALLFCPNCHRRVDLPKFMGQVKAENGINLLCGNCKGGKLKVKLPPPEDLESGEENETV